MIFVTFLETKIGVCLKERCDETLTGVDKKSYFLMFLSATIYEKTITKTLDTKFKKKIITHVPSRLSSSIAASCSMSSDK